MRFPEERYGFSEEEKFDDQRSHLPGLYVLNDKGTMDEVKQAQRAKRWPEPKLEIRTPTLLVRKRYRGGVASQLLSPVVI